MRRRPALRALWMAAALAACGAGDGSSGDEDRTSAPAEATAAAAPAGGFDYWVLALSWSPEYCASDEARPDSRQCARPHEFIVHGLWPQYERGHPTACDTGGRRVSVSVADRLAPLVPDRGLVFHQWRKHGSCSGLDPDAYFATLERAGRGVRVPSDWLRAAAQGRRVRHDAVEQAFIEANPELTADAIAVDCRRQYLREVRICLDRDLAPRACGPDVRDACPGPLQVRPSRAPVAP